VIKTNLKNGDNMYILASNYKVIINRYFELGGIVNNQKLFCLFKKKPARYGKGVNINKNNLVYKQKYGILKTHFGKGVNGKTN
jgi:hypothetical protein